MYDSEIYDVEGRTYLQPTLSSGEQEAFIGALRDTVNRNTAQINRQTRNLGTQIPSIQGGLTGSEGYFAQRYQTIPVETQTKTLKATAQAKALNDLLSNYQAQYKNRLQQAARSAARRASSGGGSYYVLGGDTETEPSGLEFNVNQQNDSKKVSTAEERVLGINTEPSGQAYTLMYQTPYKDPVKVYLKNLTTGDDQTGVAAQLGTGYNGQIKTLNGTRYIWMDTGQYAPSWYRVGATSAPVGGN